MIYQSKFGTFINDERRQKSDLENGDIICLIDRKEMSESKKHDYDEFAFGVGRRNDNILVQTCTVPTIVINDSDSEDDWNDKPMAMKSCQNISDSDYEEGEPSNVDPSTLVQKMPEPDPVTKVRKPFIF